MDSKIRGISVNNLEIYIMRERETKKKKSSGAGTSWKKFLKSPGVAL